MLFSSLDADLHGLILRVSPSGSKQWIWRGTVHGKRRDLGLGGYPYTVPAERAKNGPEHRCQLSALCAAVWSVSKAARTAVTASWELVDVKTTSSSSFDTANSLSEVLRHLSGVTSA